MGRELRLERLWPRTRPFEYSLHHQTSVSQRFQGGRRPECAREAGEERKVCQASNSQGSSAVIRSSAMPSIPSPVAFVLQSVPEAIIAFPVAQKHNLTLWNPSFCRSAGVGCLELAAIDDLPEDLPDLPRAPASASADSPPKSGHYPDTPIFLRAPRGHPSENRA